MKKKIYTTSYNLNALKTIDNGGVFTADEHAYLEEHDRGEIYDTKASLLREYLPAACKRLANSDFLIDLILKHRHQTIVSLGAGACVKEYLLKTVLPEPVRVIATDFDPFIIKKTKAFFPEISIRKFDFANGNINGFFNKLGGNVDLVIFFGSAYVMDDQDFIRVFKTLKSLGVKHIIDFNPGFIGRWRLFRLYFLPDYLRQNSILRKLIGKAALPKDNFRGKFHGYERTRGSLQKLYRESGWKLLKEIKKDRMDKYIAILSA